jgi:cell division protein FtsN
MVSLPNRRLKEQWVRSAVECLARDLIVNARNPSDTGPMYHSLHSLILYRQRLDPNYLIPKRNSPLKLAERNRPQQLVKQPGLQQSATLPQTITPQSAEVEAPAQPATQPAAQTPTQTSSQTPSQPASKVSVAPRPVPLTTGTADAVDGRDTIVE